MSFDRAIGPLLVVLVLLVVVGVFMWAVIRLSNRLPTFTPNPRTLRRYAWFYLAVSALMFVVFVAYSFIEGEIRPWYALLALMFLVNGAIQVRETDPRRIAQREAAGPSRIELYFDRHPLRLAAVLLLAIVGGVTLVVLILALDVAGWRT